MGKIKSFEDFDLWKKAHKMVLEIYKISRKFPDEEKQALGLELRTRAFHVPAYIAEGFRRRVPKERVRYYQDALTDLEETKYYLVLARDLGYIDPEHRIFKKANDVGRILYTTKTNLSKQHE